VSVYVSACMRGEVCKFEVSVNGDSETTGGGRVIGVHA
jgi:hypothetical protein